MRFPWPRMRIQLLTICVVSAFVVIPGFAAQNDDLMVSRSAVEELPFIKAYAYSLAIERFCFAPKHYATIELRSAALRQEQIIGFKIVARQIEVAATHLIGDQSACAPAMRYVEGAEASINDAELKFEAAEKAAAEAEKSATEREKEREAKAQTEEAERKLRALITSCSYAVSNAKSILMDNERLLPTALPDQLSQCVSGLPKDDQTRDLIADAKAMLPPVNVRMAEQNQRAKAATEKAAREARALRESLDRRMGENNRRMGKDYSVMEFCAYILSPEDGKMIYKYTRQQKSDIKLCLAALDPVKESDVLGYMKGVVSASPSSFD